MSLVDRDRFEFVNSDSFESRHDLGINDFSDLMRRLLKEELLKFDGTPLFPERRAYTVNYSLSDQEMELYNDVTNYVQQEFNRADQLSDRRRVASVGFALTILQRRLASSPEAIYQSIKRRRARLEERLTEERKNINYSHASRKLPDDIHPELYDDELPSEELEYEEDKIIDEATASTNRAELEAEIQSLKILEDKASQVRQSQVDKKWEELSNIIQNEKNMFTLEQLREKLIIFTEHKDTLNYLTNKIRTLLGDPSAVVNIHGGMNMRERKRAEALFKNDKSTYILIATDAAGEGINLQRAHLMVNYDLPWNPNRLEQRFGRIHRIGQLEVCHLWNLVASETREGMVFNMLLRKLETEKEALGGKVFDILGTINFDDRPLRDLLIEAVRYGNDPEIKKRLTQVVSETLDHSNLIKILEQNALVKDVMDENRVFKIREEMERLEAHKIQPCYVMSFFQKAIKELNGTMHKREQERFEITHVPAILRERYRAYGYKKPILSRYERICFEKKYQNVPDKPLAEFIGPGHPLLDTLVDAIFAQYYHTLKEGTILINENDFSSTPKVLSYVETSLVDETLNKDGTQRLVSKKVHFVAVGENGATKEDGYAPYLDYREPSEKELELIKKYIQDKDFLSSNFETLVENFTITEIIPKHLEDTKKLRLEFIEKTENAVNERLTLEVRYWDSQKVFLENAERAGHPNPNLSSAVAKKRADDLNSRYVNRMAELKKQKNISSLPPAIVGCSLVIPQGLLDELAGSLKETEDEFASYEERKKIEKIAMDAVMKIEASLGYSPKDVHTLNLGYDIESRVPEQLSSSGAVLRFIEVKGRKFDQNTITLSINEIQTALNKPEDYILAIIKIHNDKINIKYFKKFVQNCPDFAAASVNYTIKKLEKCDLVVYNIDLVLPLDF
jgi:hypothetical protein